MTLEQTAREFIKEQCNEMKDESTRREVGGSTEEIMTYEGKEYDVVIQAFWESSNWYDATVRGHGVDLSFNVEEF